MSLRVSRAPRKRTRYCNNVACKSNGIRGYANFRLVAKNFKTFCTSKGIKDYDSKSVFVWWNEHGDKVQLLGTVAATLCSVGVSSASVERLFSTCGLIRTARRNKLKPLVFDALVAFGVNDPILYGTRREKLEKRQSAGECVVRQSFLERTTTNLRVQWLILCLLFCSFFVNYWFLDVTLSHHGHTSLARRA